MSHFKDGSMIQWCVWPPNWRCPWFFPRLRLWWWKRKHPPITGIVTRVDHADNSITITFKGNP